MHWGGGGGGGGGGGPSLNCRGATEQNEFKKIGQADEAKRRERAIAYYRIIQIWFPKILIVIILYHRVFLFLFWGGFFFHSCGTASFLRLEMYTSCHIAALLKF